MLQNFLVTSSLNIWHIISLCKFLVTQRSQRQSHSTTQWDRNSIDNLRKCLAYLFLYLKAVIGCLLYTRQLVLLQIINLSWPALSFAVWHFSLLITSVRNRSWSGKLSVSRLCSTFVSFMFLTPSCCCGDIPNSFSFESPRILSTFQSAVLSDVISRWDETLTVSVGITAEKKEQKNCIYLTAQNVHWGCAELEDLLLSQKDCFIIYRFL